MSQPQFNHEYAKLIVANGDIMEHAIEGLRGKPYMVVHPVAVTAKLGFTEVEKNQCEYRFRLRSITDPVWRFFFKTHLSEFEVRFEGAEMIFRCVPVNLDGRYAKIKEAIQQANDDYLKEREVLKTAVTLKMDEKSAKLRTEEERKAALKKHFDALEL